MAFLEKTIFGIGQRKECGTAFAEEPGHEGCDVFYSGPAANGTALLVKRKGQTGHRDILFIPAIFLNWGQTCPLQGQAFKFILKSKS